MSFETTETLSLVTYEELRAEALQKANNAYSEDRTKGWAKLADVIDKHISSDAHHADLDRIWRISRICVTGFRGVSPHEPLVIDLPATAGLNVFHGENGSGKSSVARALIAALRPTYHPGNRADRPKKAHSPWSACEVHADTSEATVQVTLRADSGQQLHVTAIIPVEGERRLTITRSNQPGGESDGASDLGSDWGTAFEIHRPVFCYAEERGKITNAGDLKSFLYGQLLLGGSFDTLRGEIAEPRNRSREARDANDQGRNEFRSELDRISDRYRDVVPELPEVALPGDEQKREEWLQTYGFFVNDAADHSAPVLTPENLENVREALERTFEAMSAYREAASEAWGPLEGALHSLAEDAEHCDSVPDDECPVCASEVDWQTGLIRRLDELAHLQGPRSRADRALNALRGRLEILKVMSELLAFDDAQRPHPGWVPEVANALRARDVLQSGGLHRPQVLDTLTSLHELFGDPRFTEIAQRLVMYSRERQQWNRERSEAARRFVDIWWQHRDAAREFPLWDAVVKSIDELERQFHKKREPQLRAAVQQTCTRLLGDAQPTLKALDIGKNTAAPTFAHVHGNAEPQPLGVLSAGQQNAFLLAPVVGPRAPRPFGFVVFDDPVHALDDLRIEELAKLLRVRAATHQVIVLTHDERLTEALRHSTPDARTFTLERTAATSVISVTPDQPLWKRLLDASADALDTGKPAPTVRPGVARSLMRQAVDAAIRDAVIKHVCATDGLALDTQLYELNGHLTTERRLRYVRETFSGTGLADDAAQAAQDISQFLPMWDKATHRDSAVKRDGLNMERKAARRACERMTEAGNDEA